MSIDPKVQAILEALDALGGPRFIDLPAVEARDWFNQLRRPYDVSIGKVEDRGIPGPGGTIPTRIYTPLDAASGLLPALIYFHGGGWVVGNIDSHDPICRSLANASGCRVISVDYRLAPEHPWPAAPDDCYAAVQWVSENATAVGVDANRLAVGGDSAGGNLSAVVTLRARAAAAPAIAFQLLIYPALDASMGLPSIEQNAVGYFLEKAGMEWFYTHYLPDHADMMAPDVSPLHADDLSGLPPAYVITAEYDPLRDEGRAYADRLKAAGVPVEYQNYPTMIHGFFGFQLSVETARYAVQKAGHALAKALG